MPAGLSMLGSPTGYIDCTQWAVGVSRFDLEKDSLGFQNPGDFPAVHVTYDYGEYLFGSINSIFSHQFG